MRSRNMPVGVDDFKKLCENYYLVDKTDFIRQLIDGHSEVTLITRPRRFGKTLTMSMPKYHWLPFLVECISGSRVFVRFLVELGALMIVASTIVPPCMRRPARFRRSLTESKMAFCRSCSSNM